MMYKSNFLCILLLLFISCEKENGNEVKISHFNEIKSHNMGKNCMNCHTSGGEGEGWFTLAGTVYDSLQQSIAKNVVIQLFDDINGSGNPVLKLEGDANGNFYTTENIDFANGLYPSVTFNSNTLYMSSAVTTGHCNSCHGMNTAKLWVK